MGREVEIGKVGGGRDGGLKYITLVALFSMMMLSSNLEGY